MHGGIPKLRRLSILEYLLGIHGGIPKLERLTLPDLLSSSSIAHLETPFIHDEDQPRRIPWSGTLGYIVEKEQVADTRRLTGEALPAQLYYARGRLQWRSR